MSYTELESGYHSLKQASSSDGEGGAIQATSGRPGFYVGDEGDLEPTDGLDSDESSNSGKQVVVAVCAMSKKSQSKPMKEILTRLQEFEYIRMVVLGEEIILNEPVDRWPQCDCLISFHSKGFPLDKAIQYAQLRQPYVINNLHMQFDIQDRRRVYAILEHEGIEIPRYAVLDRDSLDPKQHELVESEDHVEVNGIVFNKPFVEKPVSAEDHNIYIYYPTSAGGGSQRLFRKIGSRSSVYSPESRVRKTGSFIYEDFMPTDGTDVKVYTVGPDYAHAEARKSPALDGKVERDSDGKEIRYPVILGNAEKLISRKVCLAFKQTVCGFDLLRANGKSFVCDVNGFSFVKNSNKYYDDCAKILGNMILRELAPQLHIPWSVPFQLDDPPIVPTTFGKMMELRCVTAVIRHGDRTPKQKMKVEVRHQKFFEIFEKYDGYRFGHIKLKRPKQLQEILDIARSLLAEIQTKAADSEIEEKQSKLEQLKSVLEMYGHFSGINRKVQMKYQPKGRPRGSSSDDADVPKEPSLVLILKWGGELTPAGRIQAEEMGRIFRCMYPGGQSRQPGVSEGPGTQGLGLLRLHSTFRHDLKIYASDEGRVQMTAAAFAKGLLALEGELTPILVQMVKSANTNGLLDNDCDSSKYQNMAKSRLHELMQTDREFTSEDRTAINPGNAISINLAMNFVKNPVQCCSHVHSLIRSLMAVVAVKRDDPKTRDATLYHGETWELMGRRWGKIEKDFCTKSKSYDISKIPDIYDCIKYDLQHNQHTLQFDLAEELYISAKYLADIVIPQEYGLTMHEKLTIGQGICTPLLKKIRADLQRNIEEVGGNESVNRLNPRYSYGVSSPGRHVRTRLYFTSESHVHSLLTVLRHGGLLNMNTDEQWRRAMEYVSMVSELNYMSQIVIMLYEDPMKDPSSEERFHVELHFSPGVNCCVQKNLPPGPGFRPHSRNDSVTSKNASGDEDSTSRIDEENDTEEECSVSNSVLLHQTLSKTIFWDGTKAQSEVGGQTVGMVMKERRTRKVKSSSPIPIGSCHTVSGHEAMDLAKRLSEELAVQQQQQHNQNGSCGMFGGIGGQQQRALSPDTEPRARSFEHEQSASHDHHHHHVCAKSSTRRAKAKEHHLHCCTHGHGERSELNHHTVRLNESVLQNAQTPEPEKPCAIARVPGPTGDSDVLGAKCTEIATSRVDKKRLAVSISPMKDAIALRARDDLMSVPSMENATLTAAESKARLYDRDKTLDIRLDQRAASESTVEKIPSAMLYTRPLVSSYSCDSISEFTPQPDEQDFYVSSFSESEEGDDSSDSNGSEDSRYYSALGHHGEECLSCKHLHCHHHHHHHYDRHLLRNGHTAQCLSSELPMRLAYRYCRHAPICRSLSYTFSNEPVKDIVYQSRPITGGNATQTGFPRMGLVSPIVSRSVDELLHDDDVQLGNCCACCRWPARRFSIDDRQLVSRSSSPTMAVEPRQFGRTENAKQLLGGSLLVHYPIGARMRYASDPSLPLGPAWADDEPSRATIPPDGSTGLDLVSPQDEASGAVVFMSLTTPPPDDDVLRCDGSREFVHRFRLPFDSGATAERPAVSPLAAASDHDDGSLMGTNQEGNDNIPSHIHCSVPPLMVPHATNSAPTSAPLTISDASHTRANLVASSLVPITVPCRASSVTLVPITSIITTSSTTNTTTRTTPISNTGTNLTTRSFVDLCVGGATVANTASTTDVVATSTGTSTANTIHALPLSSPDPLCFANIVPVSASVPPPPPPPPPAVPVVINRNSFFRCSTKLFVKSYTTDGGDCRMATSTVTTTTAALAAAAPAAAPLRTNGSDPSVLAPSSNSGGFGIRASCCCSQSAHCRDGATPVTSAAGVASRTPGGGTKTVVPHGGSPNSTSSSQSSCGGCCCCCGCDCCYCAPSLALTGAGTGTTGTTATTAIRRQRHSIAGQMSYFKMLGTFSKKMATSTNSLFSTAVISGSSSAPNLRDMIPSTASPSGFGGVPPIRPLETLHNALSLRQLDTFLDRMTVTSLFKTPASSPPPKHPVCQPMAELQRNTAAPTSLAGLARSIVPEQTTGRSSELLADKRIATASLSTPNDMVEPVVRQANAELPSAKPVTDDPCTSVPVVSSSTAPCPRPAGSLTAADGTAVGNGAASGASQSWSDHSSMTSSISALSSGGPSSPNFSELPSTDMSASITSTSSSLAAAVDGNRRADQLGCMLNLFTHPTNNRHRYPATGESMVASASGAGLIFPIALSSSIAETYSKTEDGVPIGHGVIERRGSTLDDNGDLTPISIYSDWDNTAQPTKCSTSTANELQAAMEEDDDDATISIDTCLSTRTTSEQQATLAREWPPTVATRGVHQFPQTAEKTANLAFSTNSVRPPGVPARRTMSVGISAEFAKIEDNAGGPIRGSRIQRQISLYERDSRTEANNSTQEREPPVRCPGSKPILQLHMSLDEQRKDLSSLSGGGSDQQKCLRTRQLHSRDESGEALTLTSNATHAPVNPGALLIREGFIDPPRLTRVTKSFHGKTDHQTEQHQQKHREHGRRTASIEDGSRWSHMDDSGASGNVGCGDNTLLGRYITNCNRQQSVGSAGSSGGGLYQGRFTMLIVQEPPPEKALTNTGVPLARESFSRDDGDTSKK
ncbi:uncharacterized protein LOC128270514 isoform X2 [Anopheles cruzii]|uniref:uncharacterized protein LOC128270514 isoform X2 n=1 Tax=Anopheles cruzii TaxID=68878 RepID=UPI0022EC8BA5|nr:uncharacterized protein LOC128270514 isoform X2 [Anopheles cruzii]